MRAFITNVIDTVVDIAVVNTPLIFLAMTVFGLFCILLAAD